MKQGKDVDAYASFTEVLQIKVEVDCEAFCQHHDLDTRIVGTFTLRNIAVVLQKLHRHEEAMGKFQKTLAILNIPTKRYDHSDTVATVQLPIHRDRCIHLLVYFCGILVKKNSIMSGGVPS